MNMLLESINLVEAKDLFTLVSCVALILLQTLMS